jgi:hypothetical protein
MDTCTFLTWTSDVHTINGGEHGLVIHRDAHGHAQDRASTIPIP